MERSFSQFGHARRFRIDSALGLDDQQVQIDELEDIEFYMPDVQLEMIDPSPADIQSLRLSLDKKSRDWPLGFYLYSKIKVDEELHDVTYEVHLPENYPSLDEPTINFNCPDLTDDVLNQLSVRLDKHIRQNGSVNGLLLDCIGWVQHQVTHALRNRGKPFSEIEFVPVLR